MKLFRTIAFTSFLALAGGTAAATASWPVPPVLAPRQGEHLPRTLVEVIERAEAGVVVVLVENATGDLVGQGSGFFIDHQHVVTNKHVINGASSAEIKLENGRRYAVLGLVAEDSANDLVLLRVDIPRNAGHRPLRLSSAEPRKGDEVYVLGAPRGLEFSVSRGIVSAIRPVPGMTSDRVIQTDAPISPGNSGGPLINSAGEVIGVASFIRTDGANLGFAQSAVHVAGLRAGTLQTLESRTESGEAEAVARAESALRSKRYSEAIPLLVKVLETNPAHPTAWFLLGLSLGEVGKPAEGVAAFERHLRNGATGAAAAETHFNIGILSTRRGDLSAAKRAFQNALDLQPRYASALLQLGMISWREENWLDVVKYYSRLLELDPSDSAVRTDLSTAISNLGANSLRNGQFESAARLFREALKVDDSNNRARLGLGYAAHALGFVGTLRQMYLELLDRDPALAAQLRALVS